MFKGKTNKLRFLKVTYFTLMVFVLETVFFHVINYYYDYFSALLIISYVILGFGIGAFISSRIKISEKRLFTICSIGSALSIYAVTLKMIYFPDAANYIFLIIFIFPAIYIAGMYKDNASNQIYLFDMLGAFFGIGLIILLYNYLSSETIILMALLLIPIVGLALLLIEKPKSGKLSFVIYVILILASAYFYYNQTNNDEYNLYNLISCKNTEFDKEKTFCRYPEGLVKSYDNLMGRIDVTKVEGESYRVSYDGYSNDHFNTKSYRTDSDVWPTGDIRVMYGLVPDPEVLVIGSSAQGIIKPLKQITSVESIDAIEINRAVMEIMQKDFYEQSGRAYEGISTKIGNGLSYINSTKKKYDIITLINVHTFRNLPYNGPPDYLHTKESYNSMLDGLTDDGYLLLEERAETERGRLAFYRQIKTLYQTLKDRGVENPLDHLMVWSWNWQEHGRPKYWQKYYISLIVTKNPLQGQNRQRAINWVEYQKFVPDSKIQVEFMNGYYSSAEFSALMPMIESDDFSSLGIKDFDSSVVTNDRPFLTQSITHNDKLSGILYNLAIISLLLWFIFSLPLFKHKERTKAAALNAYFILIGFAFFFVETILFQVYQNVFVSISASFIMVLGFILLSSGIGGYYSKYFNKKYTIIFLVPLIFASLYLPSLANAWSVPILVTEIISVAFICLTGFFMGMYFPKGLSSAKQYGLKDKIPNLFAINAVAGSFAVVSALFLGIKIGYQLTLIIALCLYVVATMIQVGLNKWKSA